MKMKNTVFILLFVLSLGYTTIYHLYLSDYSMMTFDLVYDYINKFIALPILMISFIYLLIQILENKKIRLISFLFSLVLILLYICIFPLSFLQIIEPKSIATLAYLLDLYSIIPFIITFFGISITYLLKKDNS